VTTSSSNATQVEAKVYEWLAAASASSEKEHFDMSYDIKVHFGMKPKLGTTA
jgi:hypothetical protein